MKKAFIFILIFLQASCYYSDGCVFTPQMVNCYYGISEVQTYQDKNNVGHTNIQKRWKDIMDCGAPYSEDGYVFIKLQRLRNNVSVYNETKAIHECMIKKGYIYFTEKECYKNKNCN